MYFLQFFRSKLKLLFFLKIFIFLFLLNFFLTFHHLKMKSCSLQRIGQDNSLSALQDFEFSIIQIVQRMIKRKYFFSLLLSECSTHTNQRITKTQIIGNRLFHCSTKSNLRINCFSGICLSHLFLCFPPSAIVAYSLKVFNVKNKFVEMIF